MTAEQTVRHQYNGLLRNASEKRKSSNEEHIYDLGSTSNSPRVVMPQQPRNRPLKTYTSSKLRTVNTYLSQNTSEIHAEPSPALGSDGSPEADHPYAAATAKLQDNVKVDKPRPTTEPLRANPKRLNEEVRERLKCSASKEEIEQALHFTPNPQRYKRRREAEAAALNAGMALFVAVVPKAKTAETTIAKPQISKTASNRDQEDGSQDSAESRESITLEETFKRAHQKPQASHSVQSYHEMSSTNFPQHRDLPVILHAENREEDEDEEEAEESASQGDNEQSGYEEHQLDDLDVEILNLSGNDEGSADDEARPQLVLSPRSPKRPRTDRDSPDLYDFQQTIDDEDDAEYEQPTPKKNPRTSSSNPKVEARDANPQEFQGRRASKQSQVRNSTKNKTKAGKSAQGKKEMHRSLPVNELVLVSERFDTLDAEVDEETPPELPEDPISQLSVPLEELRPNTNGKKSFRRLNINVRPGKGFGTVNTSEYRLPKSKVEPPGQRSRATSHSDGFVGHEAIPTGILMPIRKQHRRQQIWRKLTVRMGELILVAEREFGESGQEKQAQVPSRKKKAKKSCHQVPENVEHEHQGDDPTVVNDLEDQLLGGEEIYQRPLNNLLSDALEQPVVEEEHPQHQQNEPLPHAQERTTPQIITSDNAALEFPSRSPPLRQKAQLIRKVTFQDGTAAENESQSASAQSGGPFRRHHSNEVSFSQQLKITAAAKKPFTPKKKEIEVLQQLMMVSIPRSSLPESDSEDDSENDSGNENVEAENDTSEEDYEGSEEERSDTPEESSEEVDAESDDEVEVEEDGKGILGREDHGPALPRTPELIQPPRPSKIEFQIPVREMKKPTLRREDAQNLIFEMSPRHLPNGLSTSQRSATRRRSSRLQEQQALHSHELLPNSVNKIIVDEPEAKARNAYSRRRSALAQDNDLDSWRPREPITSSLPMEVEDDEIVDTPSPLAADVTSSNQRTFSARRLSRMASQALTVVASRPASPQQPLTNNGDSQGSVELGNTQRLLRVSADAYIPETQFSQPCEEGEKDDYQGENEDEDEDEADVDVPNSQLTFVIESRDYFEGAPQCHYDPIRKLNLVRRKSIPAVLHTPHRPGIDEAEMMTGGVTMAAAFQHTIPIPSRSKSSAGGMNKLMTSIPAREKSLRVLTRQASVELGTLPPSTRRRMVSLPFVPPFKK